MCTHWWHNPDLDDDCTCDTCVQARIEEDRQAATEAQTKRIIKHWRRMGDAFDRSFKSMRGER